MKRIGIRANMLLLVIVFFMICAGVFASEYWSDAEKWVFHPANSNLYQNGMLMGSGRVVTTDGTVLYTLGDEGGAYASDEILRRATLHAVGDPGNNIQTGVLLNHRNKLIGYNKVSGTYSPFSQGNTIHLTLDAELSKKAYQAMGKHNGTIGVYNYQTGEILCMVSKPSFDPQQTPDLNSQTYEGVYINRLLDGLYVPGSILKLITTVAALEEIEDITTQTFTCKGGIEIDGEWVKCAGDHGKIDLDEALAKSCNAAFAVIANQLGKQKLTDYVRQAGVDQQFRISGFDTRAGRFQVSGASLPELAWAGIGQHSTMINPMQFLIYMGAIARGGQAVTPYYIDSVKAFYGFPQYLRFPSKESRMIQEETAQTLKQMMRNNAKVSYQDKSFAGMNLCAKTGTAQVDDGASHAWFAGFLDQEQTPLAFVIILEHAGSAANQAIPVANQVLKTAVERFETIYS